ncbi:glutamate racemase [Sulfurospirillum sp. T05]|uniref:Glutamate racemase n=1 Tax=Sulfurospirillum tamanense TaxID=2813362 RepID=A0ABS2WTH0_9BACT|nr:glutamate racemase [Sulfurospirillum tamanensis]
MRAGVFDSGVGGLSVVRSLLEHRLFDEIIYYGDTARVPYGVKDKNTIIRYSLEAVEFFKNFDIDTLICACNSVSAYAIPELRAKAPFPVFGVIEPGAIAVHNTITNKDAHILILGTRATINSGKYQHLLEGYGFANITALAPSLFVPIVEEGLFNGPILEQAMHYYFKDLAQAPDVIILGCTHFPLIKDAIGAYFPKALLIHSGEAIVEHLEGHLTLEKQKQKTQLKLFATENPEGLKKVAATWLGLEKGMLL